jgi:two-component system, OmpR family, response regulator
VRSLLAHSDHSIARDITRGLRRSGFAVDVTNDATQADRHARRVQYDLIVLDVGLPPEGAQPLVVRWRGAGVGSPVLVVGAGGPRERAHALDRGADDVLAKGAELAELLARARALVRRKHQVLCPVIRAHDLEIDTTSRTVRRSGKLIPLTPTEYALLLALASRRGCVIPHDEIRSQVYSERAKPTSNLIHVYCRRLRQKIDARSELPLILTRWGEGYLLRGDGAI